MKKGLVDIDWQCISTYSEEEISYFLFLEGKTMEAICKIRNLDNAIVQKHIIDGKIKYRFLVKSNDPSELFKSIAVAGKEDKIHFLNSMGEDNKNKLTQLIKITYGEMYPKDKEAAVWILGELKEVSCLDILVKASVNKSINIRRMAVSAMGKLGDERAEVALLRSLTDENPQVISYAIKSLGKIKSEKAIAKIKYLQDNTDKKYIVDAAQSFLILMEQI
ncbi:HEAT repeat domain-containing protein [Clostridium tagluense]|uniref:HEAT repeat domain-containing protein n=1 Tax=Clostridium TaxID=1485 RepID=UPI0013E92938|nr:MULTISPECIES: HEAT repeat domain-containing protein [Clostridium]MBW9157816.1 HEAT repeat domain-containing protein [Clostridium tagluense]MBZ9623892.1 HEAT repeat domain-containing protein [Clostridium sp. FP2]MCB2311651.1 HEAT repeat domain-containing protein [Clostridium tagluense]MCB2316375.1 HEAT repeat domain-containing protein [Clostridium tagluense]MCB2321240.1 HEAT repeat domain-containing protein [Clostridium tagluense]